MATVVSLTKTQIEELLSGWEEIGLSQDQINGLVIQLQTRVISQEAYLENFLEVVKPEMEAQAAAAAIELSDLKDVTLPALQADMDQANIDVETMMTVTIPSLQNDVISTVTNVNERPSIYVQPDEPTDPDDDERDLVVGDTWFDSDDDNTQRIWNGVEWSTFKIDVADFTLTAQKFKTSTHMLY